MVSSPFIVERNKAMSALFWKSTICLTPGEVPVFSPLHVLLSAPHRHGEECSLHDPCVPDEPQRLCLLSSQTRKRQSWVSIRCCPTHSQTLTLTNKTCSSHLCCCLCPLVLVLICQYACVHSRMIVHFPGPRCPRQRRVNSAGQGSQ